jgi:2-oxoglutarate ferredoxin oxidoreductase subunit alpha
MGQMVEDVERSVQGKRPVHWYGKSGGDVPTPEEIMDEIKALVSFHP